MKRGWKGQNEHVKPFEVHTEGWNCVKAAERDTVKELVHHVPCCAHLSGNNTRLHLHAIDLSRCTDGNSSGEGSKRRIESPSRATQEHLCTQALFGWGRHFERANVSWWLAFSSNIQPFYLGFTENSLPGDGCSHRLIHWRGALCDGVNLLYVVKCLSTTFWPLSKGICESCCKSGLQYHFNYIYVANSVTLILSVYLKSSVTQWGVVLLYVVFSFHIL